MSLEIEIEERMYVSQERSYHLSSGKRIRVSPGVNGIAQVRRFSSGVLLETFVITDEQTYGEYFKDMRFSVKCIAETVLVKLGEDNREIIIGSGSGDMLAENNLSDLASAPTARDNLGLGNLATRDAVTYGDLGTISITDYGAIGDGVTDNFQAVTDAMAAASGRKIVVPMDLAGGDYAVRSGSVTLTGVFEYESGARIYASGGTVNDNSRFIGFGGGGSGETGSATFTRGLNVNCLTGNTGAPSVGEVIYNYVNIRNDRVDAQAGGGTKVNGFLSDHIFGGATAKGGRHALVGRLIQNAATSADSTDRFYVGVVGNIQSSTGDGGTPGNEKGSYFGFNSIAHLKSGATDAYTLSGCEFNSILDSGASALNRTGLQVVGGGDGRGSSYDAAISVSNLAGSTNSWLKGIDFTNRNGVSALGADSIAFSVSQPGPILTGLMFTCPISGSILRYVNGAIDLKFATTGMSLNSANYSIELGSITSANTPYIDFHSSGLSADHDARILASGGTGTNGQGTLTYSAATHSFVGGLKFGTFTTDAAATIAGYITITDAGGTARKLLVAA